VECFEELRVGCAECLPQLVVGTAVAAATTSVIVAINHGLGTKLSSGPGITFGRNSSTDPGRY
jgi:hypothetical protein